MDISPINTASKLQFLLTETIQQACAKRRACLRPPKMERELHTWDLHESSLYIGQTQFQIFQGQLEDDEWTAQ
jgi:hypothetical protein